MSRGAPDSFTEREGALVDDLADDPPEHQPGGVIDPHRVLAERGEELLDGCGGGARRVRPSRELDQAGLVERGKGVKADRATARVERRERAGRAADRLRSPLQRHIGLLALEAEIEDQERRLTFAGLFGREDVPIGLGGRLAQLHGQSGVARHDHDPVTAAGRQRVGILGAVGSVVGSRSSRGLTCDPAGRPRPSAR